MTDRHNAYVVILADDVRDDDAEPIITALRMVKGVLAVEPHVSEGMLDQMVVESRVRHQVSRALLALHRDIVWGDALKGE